MTVGDETNLKAVEFRGASFKWPGRDLLFRNLNLSFPSKKITVIVGVNGSGKSTLLDLAASLWALVDGDVTYDGAVLSGNQWNTLKRNLRLAKTHHKYFALFDECIYESVRASARKGGQSPASFAKIERFLLETFDLGDVLDKEVDELSDGYRQRALIARVLSCRPKLLILDEPFENLDAISRDLIATGLRNALLNSEFDLSLVIATQDLELAQSLAQHLIVLHNGEVAFEGPKVHLRELIGSRVIEIHSDNTVADIDTVLSELNLLQLEDTGIRKIAVFPETVSFNAVSEKLISSGIGVSQLADLSASLRAYIYKIEGLI